MNLIEEQYGARPVVLQALRGACHGCRAAGFTLKNLVETKINDFIGEEVEVLADRYLADFIAGRLDRLDLS